MAGTPKQFMLPKAVDAELERLLEEVRRVGEPDLQVRRRGCAHLGGTKHGWRRIGSHRSGVFARHAKSRRAEVDHPWATWPTTFRREALMTKRSDLVALLQMMIGADGPSTWVSNVPWPVHIAIAENRVRVSGHLHLGFDGRDSCRPMPWTGMKVEGLNAAIHELSISGELICQDRGFYCCWSVRPDSLHEYRRRLMRTDPTEAAVVYRAAQRWSALASISLKKPAGRRSVVRVYVPDRDADAPPARGTDFTVGGHQTLLPLSVSTFHHPAGYLVLMPSIRVSMRGPRALPRSVEAIAIRVAPIDIGDGVQCPHELRRTGIPLAGVSADGFARDGNQCLGNVGSEGRRRIEGIG